MDIFKMIKEASVMKSRLNEIDKSLKEKIFEMTSNGATIKMNAKSEVIDLKLSQDLLKQDVEKIERDLLEAFQKALKKSHDMMSDEAKKLTGGMKIPGLM